MSVLAGLWLGPRYKRDIIRFFHSIKSCDDITYMVSLLKFYTAPTRFGLKLGSLVNLKCPGRNLKSCWEKERILIEKELGLRSLDLKYTESSVLIYFYNPKGLERRLEGKEVKSFLSPWGYGNCQGLDAQLEKLKERFSQERTCPNEVGIFLGYPLKDVLAFHKNSKDCKCVGYWKCYSHVFLSKCKFFLYDLSKWLVSRRLSNIKKPISHGK